jgi:type 1 glutamine amidotransferase
MRILLLCDDYWHPGQVPIDGVAPLKNKGFEFDIITDAKDFSIDMLDDYSVVMMCKSDEVSSVEKVSWKTEPVQQAFIDYVEKGGGLLVIHSGLVAGKSTEALDLLIGSRFSFHPKDCSVTVQSLKPHPVSNEVAVFNQVDEHYRIDIIADDVDIFMASYSAAQGEESKYEEDPYHNTCSWIDAAGYVRKQGKGRVCVLTPGHLLPVWLDPQFQLLLENALNWCSGQ